LFNTTEVDTNTYNNANAVKELEQALKLLTMEDHPSFVYMNANHPNANIGANEHD